MAKTSEVLLRVALRPAALLRSELGSSSGYLTGQARNGLLVYNLRTRTERVVDSVAVSEHNINMSRHVFRESRENPLSFAKWSATELGVNISWY